MNVLLLRPPAINHFSSYGPSISMPIGLMSLASVLESNGYAVEVYDSLLSGQKIPINEEFYHIGDEWDLFTHKILDYNADIIGIQFAFSYQFDYAQKAISKIKESISKDVILVAGGAHATVAYEDILKAGLVDFVCLGEAEDSFLELVRRFSFNEDLNTIPGVASLNNHQSLIRKPYISNLDKLPFPAYHIVNMKKYFQYQSKTMSGRSVVLGRKAISMITSRGCPFKCTFCSISLHMGKQWRCHSAHYVLDHIDFVIKKHKIKHINFEDDNLTFNRQRFVEILDGIIERGYDLTWDTPNGVRLDTLDEELLVKMVESGCSSLTLAIESGDQYVLSNIIKKDLSLSNLENVLSKAKELKLDLFAFFVVGFPGESFEQIKSTFKLALELNNVYNVHPHMMVATPLPGTDLEAEFIKSKIVTNRLDCAKLAKMTQGSFFIDGLDYAAQELRRLFEEFSIEIGGHVERRFNEMKKSLKYMKYFIFADMYFFRKRFSSKHWLLVVQQNAVLRLLKKKFKVL